MKKFIIHIVSSFIKKLIQLSPPAVANNVKETLLAKIDVYSEGYNSILYRPKFAHQITTESIFKPLKEKVAIVIQGPLVLEDNFTLETVKIYKKNYPEHLIIVSTWNDISDSQLNAFKSIGVELVLNEKPALVGALNVNLQIVSSKNGILKAKELGCNYVYKTRTDQRFYALNITSYLLTVLQQQPLVGDKTSQKLRLVSASMTTVKYRPYGLGDMFMFGDIDDMLLYWDSKLDDRKMMKNDIPKMSVLEIAKLKLAEIYLCTNFLDKIGYTYDFTLSDTWKVYADKFYIIDFEQLQLFWGKYAWRNESRFYYTEKHSFELLNQSESVLLIAGNEVEPSEDLTTVDEGAYYER